MIDVLTKEFDFEIANLYHKKILSTKLQLQIKVLIPTTGFYT